MKNEKLYNESTFIYKVSELHMHPLEILFIGGAHYLGLVPKCWLTSKFRLDFFSECRYQNDVISRIRFLFYKPTNLEVLKHRLHSNSKCVS